MFIFRLTSLDIFLYDMLFVPVIVFKFWWLSVIAFLSNPQIKAKSLPSFVSFLNQIETHSIRESH